MDTDDLDEWLDEQDTTARRTSTSWPDRHDRVAQGDRPETRRPRWMIAGVAGAVLWLLVMVFAGLPGRPDAPAEQADADLMAAAAGASAAGTFAGGPDADDAPAAVPGALSDPTGDRVGSVDDDPDRADPEHVDTDRSDTGRSDPLAGQVHGVGVQAAAAVDALRGQLTRSDEDGDSYLELALPLWSNPIGEGIDVVVVQATWLEGAEGRLTSVSRGRWAIPVTTDGTVLTAAWPVPGGHPAELPSAAPPTGTLRLDEVSTALSDAGWVEVDVLAAELHPLLDDVLVALTRGAPPHGSAVADHVVWVQEGPAGLQLLGVRS